VRNSNENFIPSFGIFLNFWIWRYSIFSFFKVTDYWIFRAKFAAIAVQANITASSVAMASLGIFLPTVSYVCARRGFDFNSIWMQIENEIIRQINYYYIDSLFFKRLLLVKVVRDSSSAASIEPGSTLAKPRASWKIAAQSTRLTAINAELVASTNASQPTWTKMVMCGNLRHPLISFSVIHFLKHSGYSVSLIQIPRASFVYELAAGVLTSWGHLAVNDPTPWWRERLIKRKNSRIIWKMNSLFNAVLVLHW
jgi:hypothetical protein